MRWGFSSFCVIFILLNLFIQAPVEAASNKHGWSMDIYGERNSGTNWITVAAAKNVGKYFEESYHLSATAAGGLFKKVQPCWVTKFGWKHGRLQRQFLTNPSLQPQKTVFIVVFRNPYNWIISMKKLPHQAPKMATPMLSHFISQEWHDGWGKKYQDMTWEYNPETKKPYTNIFTMRTAKYQGWLDMQNVPGIHVAYVQYEKLLEDAGKALIASITKASGGEFKQIGEFQTVTGHCGAMAWKSLKCDGKGHAHPKVKDTFKTHWKQNPEAVATAYRYLNATVENHLGYIVYAADGEKTIPNDPAEAIWNPEFFKIN